MKKILCFFGHHKWTDTSNITKKCQYCGQVRGWWWSRVGSGWDIISEKRHQEVLRKIKAGVRGPL